jgi:hypothetical protein
VLQKAELTNEEMKALENTIGGIFMGVSEDSNYIFVSKSRLRLIKGFSILETSPKRVKMFSFA